MDMRHKAVTYRPQCCNEKFLKYTTQQGELRHIVFFLEITIIYA